MSKGDSVRSVSWGPPLTGADAAFDQGSGTMRRQVPKQTQRIAVYGGTWVMLGVLQKYGSTSIDSA